MKNTKEMEKKSERKPVRDTVLKHHEHIRKRPGMYIGRIGSSGLSYMLGDLILDCATKFMAKEIRINLQKSGAIVCSVRNARINHDVLMSALKGGRPGTPFALLPLTCCVALSTAFELSVANGKHKVSPNGAIRPSLRGTAGKVYRELTLTFVPDTKTFGKTGPEGLTFYQHISVIALTIPELKIIYRSDYTKPFSQLVVHCPKGVQHLLDLEVSRCAGGDFEHCIDFEENGVRGQVGWFYPAHRYAPGSDAIMAFANGKSVRNGGSHVEGALEGIRDAVLAAVADRKEEYHVEMNRVVSRLCLAVSVWGDNFSYAGSTKECLAYEPAKTAVYKAVKQRLETWIRTSPNKGEEFLQLFLKGWPFGNPLDYINETKK